MRKIALGIITIVFIFVSCNGQGVNERANNKYIVSKKGFDSILVSHFPNRLTSYPNTVVNNKNLSKNDVCFMLYEYNVDISKIDSILNNKHKILAQYTPTDESLLIVNRFETKDTYERRKEVEILDTLSVNEKHYKNMYPVPNFIEYNYSTGNTNLILDKSFNIFVLEAKSGTYFKEFDLQPNPQMPLEWKNGFSKGIAVSKERKTLIYWAVIW